MYTVGGVPINWLVQLPREIRSRAMLVDMWFPDADFRFIVTYRVNEIQTYFFIHSDITGINLKLRNFFNRNKNTKTLLNV